jgi:hypothetical protein
MTFHPIQAVRLGVRLLPRPRPHPHKPTRHLCLLRYPLVLDLTTIQLRRTTGRLIITLQIAFHLQLFLSLVTPGSAAVSVRIVTAAVEPWASLC